MYIGITGLFCAGKTEVAKILRGYGFAFYGFGDLLRAELEKQGISPTREATQEYANKLRAERGHGFLAELLLERMKRDGAQRAVFESIRHPAEVATLRRLHGFVLLSVDAPREVRYERLVSRARNEGISSYEEFCRLEDAELAGEGAGQQIVAVMDEADIKIVNIDNLDDLRERVKEEFDL